MRLTWSCARLLLSGWYITSLLLQRHAWRLALQGQALGRHAHRHPLESSLPGCRGSLRQIGALQCSHGIRLLTEPFHSQASVAAESDISTEWMQLSS